MIELSPSHDFNRAEQITDHVTRVWLFEGKVVLYQINGENNRVADEWCSIVSETMAGWDPNQPIIAIHDLRACNLTPYLRRKMQSIVTDFPDLFGYSIVIVPDSIMGNLMRSFLLMVIARIQPDMKRIVFKSMEESIDYIHRVITPAPILQKTSA